VINALRDADSFLPAGSIVALVPLVDGRILYDTMHARIHPIGSTNQDVTYTQFYDYLNCLDVSPCWGWMNSNETVRNFTSARAAELGAQLPLIVNATKGTFKHITPVYAGNLFNIAISSYTGPKYELIEPVDGFHPSQLTNSIIGRILYDQLKTAGVLPPVNPNNANIAAKFGQQGGYN
jgi:acyloxyacyl hydrolase